MRASHVTSFYKQTVSTQSLTEKFWSEHDCEGVDMTISKLSKLFIPLLMNYTVHFS